MRTIVMLFAAVLLAVCSCTTEKGNGNKAIIDAALEVIVPSEGGEVKIPVTVTGSEEQISAVCTADWVTELSVAPDNTVIFMAESNDSIQQRCAEMLLSCSNAENFVVKLLQTSAGQENEGVKFSFNMVSVGPSSAEIDVFPDDVNAIFLSFVMETSQYEAISEDDFIRNVVDYYNGLGGVESFLRSGQQRLEVSNLTAETDYTVSAFGYTGGTASSVSDTTFISKPAPAPEDVVFTIEITEVTGTSVTVRFTPDPVYYKYVPFAVKASECDSFGDDIALWDGFVKGLADVFIDNGSISGYEEYVTNACMTGEFYVKIQELDNGTDYYAGAIVVDEHLNVLALPCLSEKFSTPAKSDAEPVITLESVEYFDGTEIAGIYPEFSSYSGKAIVPVNVSLENSSYWFVGATDKQYYDMYSPIGYLEIFLVQMDLCLEKISSDDYDQDNFTHFFSIPWDKDIAFIGLAYNDDTKATKSEFSTVFVCPSSANAASVSEFEKYL